MDSVSLKYGGREMKLTKSEKLIAVKPRPGLEKRLLTDLAPAMATDAKSSGTLGGFRILRAEATGDDPEKALDAIRANAAVSVGSHVYHSSDDEVPFVPTGQLYIECAANASVEECQKLLEKHKLQIIEARGDRELIVQVTPASENPIKTAAALQQSPLIAVAEPDLATPGMLKAFVMPGDSMLKEQWHLQNTGLHRGTRIGFKQGADARVVAAWQRGESLSSPTVIVAVIDDGFDLTHPDLAGDWKIVAPKDFTRNTTSPVPDVESADWHGTACAGVAVGNADGTGILGAAPRSRLMPVRWGRNLSDREIEAWFGYVQEQGASVVSCSWGALAAYFPLSTRAQRAIARCAREGRGGLGCVICFAAGNENHNINDPAHGTVNGFAIHPDVIAVAASTSMDERSDYSNYGAEISICAPSSGAGGWGITTSDVMGEFLSEGRRRDAGYSPGAYTNDFGGTSSACPLVAGICAVLLSIKPDLTAAQVKEVIQGTARRIGDLRRYDARGHSIYHGYGCIDAGQAVAVVQEMASASRDIGTDATGKGGRASRGFAESRVGSPGSTQRPPVEELRVAGPRTPTGADSGGAN
jgi:subtilisin family serine protease